MDILLVYFPFLVCYGFNVLFFFKWHVTSRCSSRTVNTAVHVNRSVCGECDADNKFKENQHLQGFRGVEKGEKPVEDNPGYMVWMSLNGTGTQHT